MYLFLQKTPLHIGSKYDYLRTHLENVKFLLASGADVNAKDNDGVSLS